jgi:hypothetical protein
MLRFQKRGGNVHSVQNEIQSLLRSDDGDDLGFAEDLERCVWGACEVRVRCVWWSVWWSVCGVCVECGVHVGGVWWSVWGVGQVWGKCGVSVG